MAQRERPRHRVGAAVFHHSRTACRPGGQVGCMTASMLRPTCGTSAGIRWLTMIKDSLTKPVSFGVPSRYDGCGADFAYAAAPQTGGCDHALVARPGFRLLPW